MQGESLVVAVDDDGCFTERITDFKGRYVKDADKDIIQAVKARATFILRVVAMFSTTCFTFCGSYYGRKF